MPILSEKKWCCNIWYLHAFRGERDHFHPSVDFHFGGETAWLGAPHVALRGVWTVSYSFELECVLADFFPISSSYFLLEFSTNALPVNA